MSFRQLFKKEDTHRKALSAGIVVPDATRCVQCGICSYNCPIGIDVRGHVWLDSPVEDRHCLTCGECVARCPRGVLSFQHSSSLAKRDA